MAREPSVTDDDTPGRTDELRRTGGNGGLLHRRSYLKLAGSTTVAAALASATASADEDDYEVIEANGQNIWLGDEVWENKLIDVSNGNSISIMPDGDTTIRNVGIKGVYRGDGFIFSIYSDGEVLFENVYIGDGATKEGESFVHGPGAVFYHRDANGDVTFRNVNVQGYPNNGFYMSNSASGGHIRWERCFGKNNGVTTYRGANGDEVIECVAYNDDTDYGPGYNLGWVESDGRPVWAWGGAPMEVVDCQLAAGTYGGALFTHDGGGINVSGGNIAGSTQGAVNLASNVGSNPDLSIPDGVPTSAEVAAAGGSGASPAPPEPEEPEDDADEEAEPALDNVILFDGSTEGVTRYEFVVDGEVEKSTYDGASIDDEDVIEDDHVHGVVADWKDAFRFDGQLERLTVDGPATVFVNDEAIDPADFGEELPHTLRVEGRGVPTSYEITVDGSIELASAADPDEDATTVSGATAQSSIGDDEVQEYHFSGAITDVTFSDGKAAVFVDDEDIDTSAYGDHKLLPHALVVDGTDTDGVSSYSFEVGGKVIKSDHLGASIDDEDVIDGRSVTGAVAGWLDAFWFDGDVSNLRIDGEATARVLYNARDQ